MNLNCIVHIVKNNVLQDSMYVYISNFNAK